ncbi:hypothetical protein N7447_007461 [Penicillium robsamsonii]|uniref:uncharacterized protein n=1 Tax=Penicillium robsamsonii TaxID=1792511 RepID=UPI002547E4AA|nr:uncharacterized protein N7447_007461 [Penicillium robsamsonii]KAJ5825121.1 hypothetical protein N7447_007461 [Penicillium robsamsonii]
MAVIGFTDKSNLHSPEQLREPYHSLWQDYPIVLLEDPFAETDWNRWIEFNKEYPVKLVGDDLPVTNTEYVQEAKDKKACNSMLLKINEIGTISEAIEAANLAYSFDWGAFISHRSGGTTDDFIADLVVGLRTGHNLGHHCHNWLMDIEDLLSECLHALNLG